MNLQLLQLSEFGYRYLYPFYRPLYYYYKKRIDKFYIQLLKKNICSGMCVMDIGANIGFYAQLFSKLVGPTGQVHSFEPSPKNFFRLKQNTQHLSNCFLYEKGVSNFIGRTYLYESFLNNDHRIYNPQDSKRLKVLIDAVSLDSIFSQKEKIDFIKMDIQGAELQAFFGMTNVLRFNEKIKIISELWPHGLKASGDSAQALLLFLKNLNFKIKSINEKTKTLDDLDDYLIQAAENNPKNYFNIFCYRE